MASTQFYLRLARLDRPIGWIILLWPCWWAVALAWATHGGARFEHFFLTLIGSILMRSAGCTWNDIVDRDIDARVSRTKLRPIPLKQITVARSCIFCALQLLAALVVLLQFNLYTVKLAMLSLPCFLAYPFMKRITHWPQLALGITFNLGVLIGWSAVTGGLHVPALMLYLGGIFLTIGYDTIYACQDVDEDLLINVYSTARLLSTNVRWFVCCLYVGVLTCLTVALYTACCGPLAYAGLFMIAIQLTWQIYKLNPHDSSSCYRVFNSTSVAEGLFFLGILLDGIIKNV